MSHIFGVYFLSLFDTCCISCVEVFNIVEKLKANKTS